MNINGVVAVGAAGWDVGMAGDKGVLAGVKRAAVYVAPFVLGNAPGVSSCHRR